MQIFDDGSEWDFQKRIRILYSYEHQREEGSYQILDDFLESRSKFVHSQALAVQEKGGVIQSMRPSFTVTSFMCSFKYSLISVT